MRRLWSKLMFLAGFGVMLGAGSFLAENLGWNADLSYVIGAVLGIVVWLGGSSLADGGRREKEFGYCPVCGATCLRGDKTCSSCGSKFDT